MTRAEFSKATKLAIFKRASGRCECGCRLKIRPGDAVQYDHYPIPASMGGPATPENGRVLILKHAKERTFGSGIDSNTQIAKTTRLAEKRLGMRPKKRGFRGSKSFSGEIRWK
jgi:hypothetical protein